MSRGEESAAAGARQIQQTIQELEQGKRVAEELLFLVLDHIGEPVVLDVETSKKKLQKGVFIDLQLNEKTGKWTLRTVEVADAVE